MVAEAMPGHAPDMNPGEGVWGWAKCRQLANLAADMVELWDRVVAKLIEVKRRPARQVRAGGGDYLLAVKGIARRHPAAQPLRPPLHPGYSPWRTAEVRNAVPRHPGRPRRDPQ